MSLTLLRGFSREFLTGLFIYDPTTGILKNRIDRSHARAGDVAGATNGRGYLVVSVNSTPIRVHRLVWFLLTGTTPSQIDHRNRIRDDNRWGNLRAATHIENNGNSSLPRHNTSGFKGVSKCHTTGKWLVVLSIAGKTVHVGRSEHIWRAAAMYNFAAWQRFGSFANLNEIPGLGCLVVPKNSLDLWI